jgi:hypothetical protein
LTNFHGDEAKKEKKMKKKNPKCTTQKKFFKIANSQKKIVKILWIGPWVSRID